MRQKRVLSQEEDGKKERILSPAPAWEVFKRRQTRIIGRAQQVGARHPIRLRFDHAFAAALRATARRVRERSLELIAAIHALVRERALFDAIQLLAFAFYDAKAG